MDRILAAIQKLQRRHFLPPAARAQAEVDAPIAIGFGQTNSQPSTVALMLDWLDPQPGEKILDVGSGSGWTTALLAELVGKAGEVLAVERIPELVDFGRHNTRRAGYPRVRFFQAAEEYGLPDEAPFDRILVSASADELPRKLLNQLKSRGRMVIPVGNDILVINKDEEGTPHTKHHPGFSFVPLYQ